MVAFKNSLYEILYESAGSTRPAEAPLISVVIPLYNYQKYISGCIDSVAWQSHPNLEVIVVDDFSIDQSALQAVRSLRAHKNRFASARVVSHRQNQGLAATRNIGFKLAQAEYVFALDADNEIYPRAIERLLEAIQASQAHVAYSQLEFFDEEVGLGLAGIWNPKRFVTGNYIDAMALVKKSAWHAVGGYSKMQVMGWEDYDLWCKFVEKKYFGIYVPEILCRYRVRKHSMLRVESNTKISLLHAEMNRMHRWLKLPTI